MELIATRKLKVRLQEVGGLEMEVTAPTSITHKGHVKLAGEAGTNSDCRGEIVNVQGTIQHQSIVTVDYEAIAETLNGTYLPDSLTLLAGGRLNNKISMKVDTTGVVEDKFLGTYVYIFKDLPKTVCDSARNILTGNATIHAPTRNSTAKKIVTITETKNDKLRNVMTSLVKQKTTLCGREAYETSVLGIYIIMHRNYDDHLKMKDISTLEMNELEDIQNKFSSIFTELTMKTSEDIGATLRKICESRRESLLNHLSLLAAGSKGTITSLKEDGLKIMRRGDATTVTSGTEMKAEIRSFSTCCEELPIRLLNEEKDEAFMELGTSSIREMCTERVCNTLEPFYYRLKMFEEGKNHSRIVWMCTQGSHHIRNCEKVPEKIQIIDQDFESQVSKMLTDEKTVQTSFYDEERMKLYRRHIIMMEARNVVPASEAMFFANNVEGQTLENGIMKKKLESIKSNIFGDISSALPNFGKFISAMMIIFTILAGLFALKKAFILVVKKRMERQGHKYMGVYLGSENAVDDLSLKIQQINARLDGVGITIVEHEHRINRERHRVDWLKERLAPPDIEPEKRKIVKKIDFPLTGVTSSLNARRDDPPDFDSLTSSTLK